MNVMENIIMATTKLNLKIPDSTSLKLPNMNLCWIPSDHVLYI